MKNIFGFNVEDNSIDGKTLMIREVDAAIREKQEDLYKEKTAQEKKSSLPLWLSIVQLVCYFIGACCLLRFMKALSQTSLQTVLQNGWYFLLIGAVSLVAALVIYFLGKKKVEKVQKSEEFQALKKADGNVETESVQDLRIPEDAAKVDVFAFPYKQKKNGKKKSAGIGYEYIAIALRLFREEENICLADISSVFAFPVSGLKKIEKIYKNAVFTGWNKEEGPTEGKYKPYKIRANNFNMLFIKPYYSLQFCCEGGDFELLFPSYELEAFCAVTGIAPEEKKK